MAQQINLYSPIFLAPKRHFSARAMGQALGLFALALAALAGWAQLGSATLRRDLQGALHSHEGERQQLVAALAATTGRSDSAALEQELARLRQDVARRRQTLAELSRGLALEGHSHAAVLHLVAQTLPAPAWLTDVKLLDGRLELSGLTLQPEVLQPWLAQLAGHPLTAGQQLAAVKVERAESGDAWRFTIVSSRPDLLAAGGPR
jgi:Tfp pilus assembly protein PilN